jgi:hypothetical protein
VIQSKRRQRDALREVTGLREERKAKNEAATRLQSKQRQRGAAKEVALRRSLLEPDSLVEVEVDAKPTKDERKPSDSAHYLMARAVTKFQSHLRRVRARKQLVLLMQEEECLLAMPGTVQGRSGWYEYDEAGEAMVARFDIADDANGESQWSLVKGPMKLTSYTEALALIRARGARKDSTDMQPESNAQPSSRRTSADNGEEEEVGEEEEEKEEERG